MNTSQTPFRITIDLAVKDAGALWLAAIGQALGYTGTTMNDALDTLGSRDYPDLSACLALLVDPSRFLGCAISAIDIAIPS